MRSPTRRRLSSSGTSHSCNKENRGQSPIFFAILLCCLGRAFAAEPLPALGAQGDAITVSGVSSGGYMAVQFHVAHSAIVKGAAALAAGPYNCAQGSYWTAYLNCTTPSAWAALPLPALLKIQTDAIARSATLLDPTRNLAGSRAWLFSGVNDKSVKPEVVRGLQEFYALYKVTTVLVADKPAGHAMVTETVGNPCSSSESPYINRCGYDAAGELLRYLLGTLEPPAAKQSGRLVRFDQKPFAGGDAHAISLGDDGFAYVPKACETQRCRLHIAFHGCRQNAATIGERFVSDAGYNRWADSNRLIVLYPQTAVRYWPLFNPRGCWDWWGYTGANYATKSGPQLRAVKAMVERLSSAK
jgi:hypothetical protein